MTRRTALAAGLAATLPSAALGAVVHRASLRCAQWDRTDIVLDGPRDGNPFTDVSVAAEFSYGGATIRVDGFYDGNGIYRIRFCPPRAGIWQWRVQSTLAAFDGLKGDVQVTPAPAGVHGPVRVYDTHHFAYDDGTPYKQIGTTAYGWIHQPADMREQTLRTLAASPFNKIRMAVFPNGTLHNEAIHPFEGAPKAWDTTRFNPAFFHRLERCVARLAALNIEADIILFHPYDKGLYGFDAMSQEADEGYLRYVVARLAAFRNVWWSLANEYDLMKQKSDALFDRYFQIVQQADPYGRLRSIHHLHAFYDNNKPWVTHASIQSATMAEDSERCAPLRDIWRKPVILDEVCYEGNHSQRWAQLSGAEMVHRFWEGTIGGVYVGHSEFIDDGKDHMWIGTGGVLRGESPPRLAFLRQVLEAGPALDPIDAGHDRRVAGVAGEYYLLYFGKNAPDSWTFSLPKQDLKEGMRFAVDILDSWNMTTETVAGTFTIKKHGNYDFADEDGRAVALPGKPGMALRIKRV